MSCVKTTGLGALLVTLLIGGLSSSILPVLCTMDEKAASGHDVDVTTVHIVFMNHLDVGYAHLVNEIINEYFQTYFARAAQLGQQLHDDGFVETFIYTTHPWLAALYLDCPENLVLSGVKLQCPDATQKAQFIDAVKKGYITWHAGPFNLEPEMAHDAWLFEYGIELSKSLDKRLNVTRNTRVFSQRDVPGMTQAVIPSLVKMGVSGVTVGVNSMTSPPAVPSLFVWKYMSDSVIAAWHPGGYPDNPGDIPARPGGLSKHDCVVIPGFSHVLCFAFRTDNWGPPVDIKEVLRNYEVLRSQFPNAVLKASRLEEYFEAAESIRDKLPVITNEIGDTWIEGVASDPRRCAEYRAVSRVMRDCFQAGACELSDVRVWNSSLFILKTPEHTWGLNTESDTLNWANDKFHAIQFTKPSFIRITSSWVEQRAFLNLAIDALKDHPVTKNIQKELSTLKAAEPDLRNFIQVRDPFHRFKCSSSSMNLRFGRDGSIAYLDYHGKQFASADYRLSRFIYVSYNESDFDAFGQLYNYNGISAGYYKNNLTKNFRAASKNWDVSMTAFYQSTTSECEFYAFLTMSDPQAHILYGAPKSIWMHYTVEKNGIDIDVQLFNKTSTRLPEALFVAFQLNQPAVGEVKKPGSNGRHAQQWSMSKIGGRQIDPHNVVLNGSQYQHVLDDGGVTHLATGIKVASYDLPITVPVTPKLPVSAFPAPLSPIAGDITGFAFNIYNNIWETNYIMWYPYLLPDDANFKARFHVDLSKVGRRSRFSSRENLKEITDQYVKL